MRVTSFIAVALLWLTSSVWAIDNEWANINRHAFRYLRPPFQRDFDTLRTHICSDCLSQCRDPSRSYVNIDVEGNAVSSLISRMIGYHHPSFAGVSLLVAHACSFPPSVLASAALHDREVEARAYPGHLSSPLSNHTTLGQSHVTRFPCSRAQLDFWLSNEITFLSKNASRCATRRCSKPSISTRRIITRRPLRPAATATASSKASTPASAIAMFWP